MDSVEEGFFLIKMLEQGAKLVSDSAGSIQTLIMYVQPLLIMV